MGRQQAHKSPVAFTQIRPHFRAIARAAVVGLSPGQLATSFGFTESHMSRILQTPLFEAEIARLERKADDNACDIREDLRVMRIKAIENLDEDLNIEPLNLQARALRGHASRDILDRTGIRKQDKPIVPAGGTLSVKQTIINIERMSEKELREDVMDLIEGEVEEEE